MLFPVLIKSIIFLDYQTLRAKVQKKNVDVQYNKRDVFYFSEIEEKYLLFTTLEKSYYIQFSYAKSSVETVFCSEEHEVHSLTSYLYL